MSWRTVSRIAAVSAIAVLMLASVPAAYSDAHEAKEADNGVHFRTSSPLSSGDIDRLFYDQSMFVEYAMAALYMDYYVLMCSDVFLSDMSVETSSLDRMSGLKHKAGPQPDTSTI